MQVESLKNSLLDKLISIEDERLLEKVNQLIGDVDLEKKVFKVSDKQQEMLSQSESDFDKENMEANEDLNAEEERWLNG